jgi:hypothetical protein
MIDLYYWTTPNGHKITMFLEETGLPYRIVPVNIGKGEQFSPEFLRISPNNRMPGIVDHDSQGGGSPVTVFESGRTYTIADIASSVSEESRAILFGQTAANVGRTTTK